MAVPTTISDLNVAAASNSPAGGDAVGPLLDNYLQSHAALIRRGQAISATTLTAASSMIIGTVADGDFINVSGNTTIDSNVIRLTSTTETEINCATLDINATGTVTIDGDIATISSTATVNIESGTTTSIQSDTGMDIRSVTAEVELYGTTQLILGSGGSMSLTAATNVNINPTTDRLRRSA